MIVCDTGPLVAAALSNDADHRACVDLFTGAHLAEQELLVSAPIVAEVGYLLDKAAGADVEAQFLRSLADGDFKPVNLTSADYARMSELVERYGDLSLGTADASVVAVAERLNVTDIATLDLRDFRVVRPRHVDALTLPPEDA